MGVGGRWWGFGGPWVDPDLRETQNRASGLTDQVIRVAVDRGVAALRLAADRVHTHELPAGSVSLGVTVNLGVIQLEMKMDVPTRRQDAPDRDGSSMTLAGRLDQGPGS